MALELVAGPFTLKDLDDTAITDFNVSSGTAAYDDAVGLFAYSGVMGGICIIQFDGTVCLRAAQNRANEFALDLQRPNQFLINEGLFEGEIFLYEKYAGIFGSVVASGGVNYVDGIQVRAKDRYLSILGDNVRTRPLDFSTSWVTEATLEVDAFAEYPRLSLTEDRRIICLAYQSGEIVYYDHIAKEQVEGRRNYVGTNFGVWYSPKFKIYISMNQNDTLSIYSNEVRPDSLSDVEAESSLTRGHMTTVKTRLLGDQDEPCVGELVNWSITGTAALLNEQSKTDEDGYAWNKVIVPTNATLASNVEVTATVNF